MSSEIQSVLVIAANGKTGRRVADRLENKGVEVRRGSRGGATRFDWQDRSTWEPALKGVDGVYIVYTPDLAIPGAADDIRDLSSLAKELGVKKAVLLSGRGEEEAQRCEQILMESGLRCTVVRASWFNQNFDEGEFVEMVRGGVLALPANEYKEPYVDVEDIADVAVAALTEEGHEGEVYEVTGPRLLSLHEVAAEISRAAGFEVQALPITMDEFAEGLRQQEVPEDFIGLLRYIMEVTATGINAHTTDGVQRALGRPARDFREYCKGAAASGAWQREESKVCG